MLLSYRLGWPITIDYISVFLVFIILPLKCHFIHLKSAKAVAILFSNKKKVEASLVLNSVQHKINDNKLSIANTSNTEGKFGT